MGGVYRIPAARVLASPSRVLVGVSGENGVRKLTNCAERRGYASESRPAHKLPGFGQTRKSAMSGDIAGGIRKSGFRDLVRASRGGVYWVPAARVLTSPPRVLQGISGENRVRKLTNCADRRGLAFESRPARKSPDFGLTPISAISGDIAGGSGARDFGISSGCHGGAYWIPAARFLTSPSRLVAGVAGEGGVRKSTGCADRRGSKLGSRPPANRPISGRCGNLRFPATLSGKSGNRDFGISSGCNWGGPLDSGGAFSDVSVARFTRGLWRKRGPEADLLRRSAGVRV